MQAQVETPGSEIAQRQSIHERLLDVEDRTVVADDQIFQLDLLVLAIRTGRSNEPELDAYRRWRSGWRGDERLG